MIYEDYIRVLSINIRTKYPEIKNCNDLPKLKKVSRIWTGGGFGNQIEIIYIWVGMQRITGQEPKMLKAIKDSNIVKKGDFIGCKTEITGEKMYNILEELNLRVLPSKPGYNGRGYQSFDNKGNYTYKRENPEERFPSRKVYYEDFNKINKEKSRSNKNKKGGRSISFNLKTKNKKIGRERIKGRGFKFKYE